MKLKSIYFDAYKSLLSEKLDITDSCIGFVGINESGKSNILKAISCLSNSSTLNIADSPRMSKGTNPKIRFITRS